MNTIREVSNRTGIKIRTIRSWVEKNKVKVTKDKKTKKIFISNEEIEKMEEENMAVRNFYLEADVDGRKTSLKGGPVNKTGGMKVKITQRSKGKIETAFDIVCYEDNGSLVTEIRDNEGNIKNKFVTER